MAFTITFRLPDAFHRLIDCYETLVLANGGLVFRMDGIPERRSIKPSAISFLVYSSTMKNIASILILLLGVLSSCHKSTLSGSGAIGQSERIVPEFHSIRSNADITVHVQYAPQPSVSVKGYQNLIDITETKWAEGTLLIQYQPAYRNIRNSNVEVLVYAPSIREIVTNGSGDVDLQDFLLNDSLDITVNGSSDIALNHCQFAFAGLNINGSGNIYALPSSIRTVQAQIQVSGDIETNCRKQLTARIAGSGAIRYRGKPSLDIQISGSGTVRPF